MKSFISPNHHLQAYHFLVKSAFADPNQAIHILQNEDLYEKLSFNTFVRLCASHPEISLKLIDNANIYTLLDGYALSILGIANEEIALQLVKREDAQFKFVGLDLARMGQRYASVAEEIFNNPQLCGKLSSTHRAMLGEINIEITKKIVTNPDILSTIAPVDYGLLCKNHEFIARMMLNNERLMEILEGVEIALIAEFHPILIKELFSHPQIRTKFDSNDLIILGRHDEPIARYILSCPDFFSLLGPLGVARLAKQHESLSDEVLSEILSQPQSWVNFDKTCLTQLGEMHESVALRIFFEPTLQDKLDLNDKVILGVKFLALAQQLLADQNISAELTGPQLVSLGQHHPSLVHIILSNPLWFEKVKGHELGLLALNDYPLAMQMVNDPELCENLNKLDTANLCKHYLQLTKLALSHHSRFGSKLSATHKEEYLANILKTVQGISQFVQVEFSNEHQIDKLLTPTQALFLNDFPLQLSTPTPVLSTYQTLQPPTNTTSSNFNTGNRL